MEYDVASLAEASGLSVDTIRYYQTLGVLEAPSRRGRHAVYDDSHRERLARVRELSERGFSLKSMRELLTPADGAEGDEALRAALEHGRAEPTYTPRAFAGALGVPLSLLRAVERTGIAEPQPNAGGDARYTESDLTAARGALKLLERGMPLTRLLELAVSHHRTTTRTVDRAVDLFDDYVRKAATTNGTEDLDAVAEAYRELMPVVTGLVAHHFERVLVTRALQRLERSGEKRSWRRALKAIARARLRLKWR